LNLQVGRRCTPDLSESLDGHPGERCDVQGRLLNPFLCKMPQRKSGPAT